MAYDCKFQATLKDHIPKEYLRYISKEDKSTIKLPEEKQMFVKKCMVPALYRKIPPSPTSTLMERVKRNGLKHSIFNSEGDFYIGEWKNDKKEGHGSYKTHSGKVLYEGEWANGKPEGYGILCHQGVHKRYNIHFEGFWKDGKPQLETEGDDRMAHGRAVHSLAPITLTDVFIDLLEWAGMSKSLVLEELANRKSSAKGYHFYKDGSYYKGIWENGVRNGFGKMWHADGTYYEGYYYNDKRHGRGLFVYGIKPFHYFPLYFESANGNRYIGDWNANFKHGFGAYYYMSSGQIQMGHWIKDSCVNSWMIDMKYRQTVEHPSEFSIPEKAQFVKQFKRYIKLQEKRSDTANVSTQTEE